MKVSVCVPTYNSEQYIGECIESVLAQTLTDYEMIVCDNHSTDQTWDIVRSYSDPHLRCYRADRNRGVASNFNLALSHARGNYVKLLCSDDVLDPKALEIQSAILEENVEVSLVTCASHIVNKSGEIRRIHRPFADDIVLRPRQLRALSLLKGNFVGAPSAVMFRRQCLLSVGGFSETFPCALDWDLWLRIGELYSIQYLKAVLCSIREHEESLTNQLRRIGAVHKDTSIIVGDVLRGVKAGKAVRRISFGRVAGSCIRQAIRGLRRGQLKWPLSALMQAFRIDPGLLGLLSFLVFFQSGILGIEADGHEGVEIRSKRWKIK